MSDTVDILMVDDNPKNLVALAAILKNPDYNLVQAYSGREALDHLSKASFALVLLDVRMPTMDGFETAKAIRNGDSNRDIPIIFVTADEGNMQDVERGYALQAVDYILKPINADALKIRISLLIALHRKSEQIARQSRLLVDSNRDLEMTIGELQTVNARLQNEINERQKAEDELQRYKGHLEELVRQRTDELQKSESKFRAVAESANDAVILGDSDGNIIFWNKSAHGMFGYTEPEILHQPATSLLPERYRDTYRRHLQQPGAEREPALTGQSFELEALRKDGTEFPAGISIASWATGEGLFYTAIVRDISARKKIDRELKEAKEAAEAASRAKSEFLSTMSHEIRTPLNAVIGMSELLADSQLDDDQKSHVDAIGRAGDTLLELINDILDLAKIEAGKIEIEHIEFDLEELLDRNMELFGIRAHEKGLELTHRIAPDTPLALVGDPTRLRQILTNLLSNAIKFTPAGGVALRVGNESPPTNRSCSLRFEVRDTGIGIASDKEKSIFEPFVQADASTTRQFAGTGLGLAICSMLAERMGGRITVDTEVGRGSSFFVTLPFAIGSGVERSPAPSETPPDLNGKRALIIDDTHENRVVLRGLLSSWGMHVTEIDRGCKALDELRNARETGIFHDLILLDQRMPDMDGFEVARQIRDCSGLSGGTVVMLTSDNRPNDVRRCRELGIASYLVKPIRRRDLLHAVHQAMGTAGVPVSEPARDTRAGLAKRILLVEDEPINCEIGKRHLLNAGYFVDTADNGQAAVERFRNDKWDLVLMDLQMPVMDGYEATREIRRWENQQQRPSVPILALTAYSIKEDLQKCLQAGCDDYITKPVRKKSLLGKIADQLGVSGNAGAEEPAAPVGSDSGGVRYVARIEPDFADIIPQILKNKRRQLQQLQDAVQRREPEIVRKLAHKMRGIPGFVELNESAAELERAATTGNWPVIREREAKIADYLQHVEIRIMENDDE